MIRPHLGSRLVSARLTFGVHCSTLPREERCGRRTNPVKSTSTWTARECRYEPFNVSGVWELAYNRAAGMGRLSPLEIWIKSIGNWMALQIMSGDLIKSVLRAIILQ